MSCPFCSQPLADMGWRKADGHYRLVKGLGYCVQCKQVFTIHKIDSQSSTGSANNE